jgi:hypothetical protein
VAASTVRATLARFPPPQPQLGIGQFHGILHSVATAISAATTEAPQWPGGRRGRIPEGLFAPGPVTVPLRSRQKASSFWITLLLVSGQMDHGPIRAKAQCEGRLARSGCAHNCLPVRVLPLARRFEFDTSRFESSLPSQPQWSLATDFGYSRKCRHFRRLAAKSPVSGEEIRASRAEGLESRGASLLAEFSKSKIWVRGCPETGCVSADRFESAGGGSNRLRRRQLCVAESR